jgi:hypothetical protein
MVALNERKIAVVRTLVEAAPDTVVGRLQHALADTGGDPGLTAVRRLVEIETTDRRLRNLMLQPIVPMCVGDGAGARTLVFPARALATLWRGLKEIAPEVVAAAEAALADVEPAEGARTPADALTRLAAKALREGEVEEFRLVARLCDDARPGGAAAFVACLDLAPVVRRAVARLPAWITHPDGETSAAARLAYKDAVAIAEDAGPRFFEMLAAHLSPSWMVLRVISAVMDKPTERYLGQSEAGGFAERLMSDMDKALAAIGRFDPEDGAETGRAAGRQVGLIARQAAELENCIALTRSKGWGLRVFNQKKALANLVERRLREAERLTAAALPMENGGLVRLRRSAPQLTTPPDPFDVRHALTLLTFTSEIRSSASYAGFSAVHSKVTEKLGALLDHYVEDVLDHIKTGDVADLHIASAFLHVAADFSELLRDETTAEIIRRRAAVACHGDATPAVSPRAG